MLLISRIFAVKKDKILTFHLFTGSHHKNTLTCFGIEPLSSFTGNLRCATVSFFSAYQTFGLALKELTDKELVVIIFQSFAIKQSHKKRVQ